MFVTVTQLSINNQLYGSTAVKVTDPYPTINWGYNLVARVDINGQQIVDNTLANPYGYEVRVGTSSTNWGTDSFSGNTTSTGFQQSTTLGWRYIGSKLTRGTSYYGQIRLTDSLNNVSAWAEFAFAYNSIPSVTSGSVTPSSPIASNNLVLSYVFHDNDGDVEKGSIIWWFKNGVHQKKLDGKLIINSNLLSYNDIWQAQIFPSDGFELGPVFVASTVTVTATAPVASDLTIEPNAATSLDPLFARFTLDYGSLDTSNVRWYVNNQLSDQTGSFVRLSTNPGDIVRFEVQPSDGIVAGSYIASPNITIATPPYRIVGLVIDNQSEPLATGTPTPSIAWTIAGPATQATKISIQIGTSPGNHNIFTTEIGPVTSFIVPDGILKSGADYYISVAAGDVNGYGPYTTSHFRVSGSLWAETVSNATGWTLETTCRVNIIPITSSSSSSSAHSSSSSSSSSFVLGTDYQAIRVYDGTKYAEIRVYTDSIVFISDIYVSASADMTNYGVITVAGKGSDIKIYRDYQLIIDGTGLFTTPTIDTFIEIGATGNSQSVEGDFLNLYYTTEGAYYPNSSNQYFDQTYQDYYDTPGQIDYVTGANGEVYFSASNISEEKSSTIYKISDYRLPVTIAPGLISDDVQINNIDTNGNYTYISHDKGVTVISNYVINPYDNDLNFIADNDPINQSWELVANNGYPSFVTAGLKIDTRATGGELYYTQRNIGSAWLNGVDNETGWTVEFSVAVSAVTDDQSGADTDAPDGGGVYVNDGNYWETIHLFAQEIRLENCGVSIPLDTTATRNYVLTGKGNGISLYSKLPTDNTYRLLASAKMVMLASPEGNASRPCVYEQGNVVHTVWSDDGSGISQVYYSSLTVGSTGWSYPRVISNDQFGAAHPQIVADNNGTIYVVYETQKNDGTDIGIVIRNQYGWSDPYTLEADVNTTNHPKIAVDRDNNVHVVWEDRRNIIPQIYYAKRTFTTGAWSTGVALTSSSFGSSRPSIDVFGANVYVAYTKLATDGTSLIYAKHFNVSWANEVLISTGGLVADYADIAVDFSNVYVVWHDNNSANYEIYSRRLNGSLTYISGVQQLTATAVASRFPSIGVYEGNNATKAGNIYVVFESGGDLPPFSGSFTPTDTYVNICYFDAIGAAWYSSNQTGATDLTILSADFRYSRRPSIAKHFTSAHICYETEVTTMDEYNPTSDMFTTIRDAVYDLTFAATYSIASSDLDLLISGQLPRREIRFGDFSGTRNYGLTFGYFRFYTKDAVAPFHMALLSPLGSTYQAVPNIYGDAWLSTAEGLLFYNRRDNTLGHTANITSPTAVRFDRAGRMYVLSGGQIYYSDDHFTFTSLFSASGIIDFGFDNDNSLWICTSVHILQYQLAPLKLVSVYDFLKIVGARYSNATITQLSIDAAGVAWVASTGGLLSIREGQVSHYHPLNSGLPSETVTGIAIRNNGVRYIATAAGLVRMASSAFYRIAIEDDAWSDRLSAIAWKNPNIIFAASGSHLYQLLVDDEQDTYTLVDFTASDYAAYSQGSACEDRTRFIFRYQVQNSDALVQLFVNGRLVERGHTFIIDPSGDNKLKLDNPLKNTDVMQIVVREDISNFGTLEQNQAELMAYGPITRVFNKFLVDGTRAYGAVDGDKQQLTLYNLSNQYTLPYDNIVFDNIPPTGNLVFEKVTSNRRIVQLSIEQASDNLSGLKEMIVSNYPNLTSDGLTPLTWQPFQANFLFDLGTDLGNVFTQLLFSGSVGTRITGFGGTIYAGTKSSAFIYVFNSTINKWADTGAFIDEPADTAVEFMIQYGQELVIGTSSASGGKIWSSNGTVFTQIAALNQPKCAAILNGNLYIGTGGGSGMLYRYNHTTVQQVFDGSLGTDILSIFGYGEFLYVGTAASHGFLYRLTTDVSTTGVSTANSFRATSIYIDNGTAISAVAVVPLVALVSDGTTNPAPDIAVFAASLDQGRIVKALNGNSFGTSYYTKPTTISQMKIDANGLLNAVVGPNVIKYKDRTWQPIYTNDTDIEDVYFDQTGFNIVTATGIKRVLYNVDNKRVYLALRDVAGNATQEPGAAATTSGTVIPFIEIQITDLLNFVNANRIVELDEYGVEVWNYDGNQPFYSANKVEVEEAEYYSEVFNGTSDHITWDIIYWDAVVYDETDLNIFVRTSASKTDILTQPWAKAFDKTQFSGGDISNLSGQYIQFKVVLSTQIRGKSPRLYAVNIRGTTRSSVHFFTTNFALPAKMLKGILTAQTFIPIAADVVFGINTDDSVDFSDYQIIEPDSVFSLGSDQIGQNVRIGVKLISPLSSVPKTDDLVTADEYDGTDIYNNVIDFTFTNTTGSSHSYQFKIELYEDHLFANLATTLYTGSNSDAWSTNGVAFPSGGLTIANGASAKVIAAAKGNAAIRCNTHYYVKIYSEVSNTDTLISSNWAFTAGCNPTFADLITFPFTAPSTGAYQFRVKFYSDPERTDLFKTYYSGIDQTGWTVNGSNIPSVGSTLSVGSHSTVEFNPQDASLDGGTWYLVIDYFLSTTFTNVSNSYSIRMSPSSQYSCGEYTNVPVVKDICLMFELDDYTQTFGSQTKTKRTIQLNL